jgi:serine/threonine protein kinase
MQFIEGANLKERIRRGVLPWQQAADWAASISETVHFAHGEGVFHRDLKPQNILVDQQDQLHLVDFGLARKLEDSEGLTMTGTIVGTIHYLAPELLTGGNLSAASEVYAIGAVLYEMLTGIPPFAGESLTELMENIRRGSPVPPSQLRPSIPIALEIVCLKCLRRAPSRRYAAAGELRDALRRSLKASSGAWMSDIFHDAARLRLRLGWIALLVVFLALCFWGWSKNQSADSNSVLMAEKFPRYRQSIHLRPA